MSSLDICLYISLSSSILSLYHPSSHILSSFNPHPPSHILSSFNSHPSSILILPPSRNKSLFIVLIIPPVHLCSRSFSLVARNSRRDRKGGRPVGRPPHQPITAPHYAGMPPTSVSAAKRCLSVLQIVFQVALSSAMPSVSESYNQERSSLIGCGMGDERCQSKEPLLGEMWRWGVEGRRWYSTVLRTLLYSTLLYSTLLYSILLYPTLFYSPLLYSPLLYSPLLYSPLLYSPLLYSPLLSPTLPYSPLLLHDCYHCFDGVDDSNHSNHLYYSHGSLSSLPLTTSTTPTTLTTPTTPTTLQPLPLPLLLVVLVVVLVAIVVVVVVFLAVAVAAPHHHECVLTCHVHDARPPNLIHCPPPFTHRLGFTLLIYSLCSYLIARHGDS